MSGNASEKIKESIKRLVKIGEEEELEVVNGYVKAINTSDNTIDFIPYDDKGYVVYDVKLGAADNNQKGIIVFPKLYSSVAILTYSKGLRSYLVSYTHIDSVKEIYELEKSCEIIETEYIDDEKSDYDETTNTGKKILSKITFSNYQRTLEQIDDNVEYKNEVLGVVLSETHEINNVTDSQSSKRTRTSTMNKVEVIGSETSSITQQEALIDVIAEQIKLGNSGTYEKAALGETLAQLLKDILDGIIAIKTTTSIGPQPILNIPTFVNIKSQVDTILSDINLLE